MRIVEDQEIILVALTRTGKDIIKEHGNKWMIEGVRERVGFSDRPGPWLFIVAVSDPNPDFDGPARQWIKESGDVRFEIEEESVGSQEV